MRSVLYILGTLSDEDIEWLTGNGISQAVPAGAPVIVEGEPLDAIFILLYGSLRAHRKHDSRTLSELQPGELIGELSLLDSRPPSLSVSALENSTVLRIPRDRLNNKLQTDFAFATRMYRAMAIFLAHRLRQATERQHASQAPDSADDSPDEIDPDVLDASAMAGTRFQWMLKKLSKS